MMTELKNKLKDLEGETFYTKTGLPYTYEFVSENTIRTSRTNYAIHLSNFQRAAENLSAKTSQLNKKIRGASYVLGIITDKRFMSIVALQHGISN